MQLQQVRPLLARESGLASLSLPLDRATAIPSRVRCRVRLASNSATTARMDKNIFANGSFSRRPNCRGRTGRCGRIAARGFLGIGDRAGEPIEFGHGEGVAAADGRECLGQAGPVAPGAAEPVVKVDPILGHAQGGEGIALGGEVLFVGGAAGVAHESRAHDYECNVGRPVTENRFGRLSETGSGAGLVQGPGIGPAPRFAHRSPERTPRHACRRG